MKTFEEYNNSIVAPILARQQHFDKRTINFTYDSMKDCWNAATEAMQAKLDAKDKELEVFRNFANEVISECYKHSNIWFLPKVYNLIDENGNPTKLLTGE